MFSYSKNSSEGNNVNSARRKLGIIFRAFDVTGHIIVREKDEIYKLDKVANFVSILPKSGINYISN